MSAVFTALVFVGTGLFGGSVLSAQDATDRKVQGMVDQANATYGPAAPRKPCVKAEGSKDEIVVCAGDDGKQWRVPSTTSTDPTSRTATRTGVPRAPMLDRGSCKDKGLLGCIGIGGVGEKAYMIDLNKIPATPKDSDAEKVAKGEMSDR